MSGLNKNIDRNTVLMNSPIGGVYFAGIGGIGMSALARYFLSRGSVVSGYDKTKTALTRELEEAGMKIHYEDNVDLIPKDVELVVYTPAIPADHKELQYYREHGYKVVKRSDVLEIITASSFNICIAGTHGKTTITTMTGHLLRDSDYGCNAFLGGISVNYGTNFWSHERDVCVVEADEYDRSFLKLSPDVAVITAMDADHLDIYGTPEAMEEAFIDFSRRLKPGGLLVHRLGMERAAELAGDRKLSYAALDEKADVHARNLQMNNGSYAFDVHIKAKIIPSVKLNMGGLHNVENALAAIAIASSLGIEDDLIRKAVASFRGVRRRFEYVLMSDRMTLIDDYAHHPEELRALISSAKALFPDRHCTVIFQPHLFSRTRDLADGFAESLDLADETILLPIYPARELPVEGVSSQMILDRMKSERKGVMEKAEVMKWMELNFSRPDVPKEVIIMAGAGDIDTMVQPAKRILEQK